MLIPAILQDHRLRPDYLQSETVYIFPPHSCSLLTSPSSRGFGSVKVEEDLDVVADTRLASSSEYEFAPVSLHVPF